MSRSTMCPAPMCSTSQSQATVVVSIQPTDGNGSGLTTGAEVPGGGGSITYWIIASFQAVICASTEAPVCRRASR